jgi:hypothetical protein
MVIAAALAGSFALLMIVRKWRFAAEGAVLTVAALACVFFIGGQVRASLWDAARFERRDFALRVAQLVPDDANLLAVDADWAREVYYGHRNIEIYEHADELEQAIESTDREAFLLVLLPEYEQLHKRFENKIIMLELPIERARRVELWRIVK